jgi:hypothetical protein
MQLNKIVQGPSCKIGPELKAEDNNGVCSPELSLKVRRNLL